MPRATVRIPLRVLRVLLLLLILLLLMLLLMLQELISATYGDAVEVSVTLTLRRAGTMAAATRRRRRSRIIPAAVDPVAARSPVRQYNGCICARVVHDTPPQATAV